MMFDITEMEFLSKGDSNWDYYWHPVHKMVVAKAKAGSGAQDSFFGTRAYYDKYKAKEAFSV